MAENIKLVCPFCVKEGRAEPVEVSPDFAWVPALLERWVPEWARKEQGFISLREAVAKDARLGALIVKRNGRDEAEAVCSKHGKILRTAKIWTTKLSVILERQAKAADRRAKEAFGSIGSILAGQQATVAAESQGVEPEGDDAEAQARAEQEDAQRRTLAVRKAGKNAEGRKPKAQAKGSTKGRSNSAVRREIDAAMEA
jgi:hypothetical protein